MPVFRHNGATDSTASSRVRVLSRFCLPFKQRSHANDCGLTCTSDETSGFACEISGELRLYLRSNAAEPSLATLPAPSRTESLLIDLARLLRSRVDSTRVLERVQRVRLQGLVLISTGPPALLLIPEHRGTQPLSPASSLCDNISPSRLRLLRTASRRFSFVKEEERTRTPACFWALFYVNSATWSTAPEWSTPFLLNR